MEECLVGFGLVFEGVFTGHSNGFCGCPVNRWSTKRPPNETKLDRWSPGGILGPHDKPRSIPRNFNTRTRKEVKGGAGGHRSVGLQNGQRGKCSDAWNEHVCKLRCTWWHDMRCMTTITTHGDKTRTRGNKYNLTPETARVGVQIGKVTSGELQAMLLSFYHTFASK